MSMNAEERKAVVEFRLEKAQRAYEQACGVVEKELLGDHRQQIILRSI